MPHNDALFVGHMLDMARTVERLVAGVPRQQFDADEKLQLALVRALQVIGEAAWRISDGHKRRYPEVPRRQIAGFRHRAVHDYFAIDYDIVWRIATDEIRPLISQLEEIPNETDPPQRP